MEKVQQLQSEIKKWSDETFGNHRIATPIIHHLDKEINEVLVALTGYYMGVYSNSTSADDGNELLEKMHYRVRMEFADCFTLLIDAAAHADIDMETLINDSFDKLEINKKRKWGEPDENGVIEHIHEE